MSTFTLTEEHQMLRDSAHDFVADKMPVTHLRALRDAGNKDGFDRAFWKQMAELGWLGAAIPEDQGGAGLGYLGAGLVLEAMGRTLAPSPYLSTAVIGTAAFLNGGNAAQKEEWLAKIAGGETIIALAVDEGPHHAPATFKTKAEKSGAGHTLSGGKTYVADGQAADLLIVPANTGKGITLFLVPASAKGVSIQALSTIDSRGAADIVFKDVALEADAVLGPADGGAALLDQILDAARVALSAEMLGSATQAFETINEYLKTRTQFGQLIGSFQSLQHRAAKMFVDIELTRSCVLFALAALDGNRNDIASLASLAKARAGETVHLVSNEMVQMHGGIGMTDAADPGLYMKRARVTEALYGSAAFHRDRYATLAGY